MKDRKTAPRLKPGDIVEIRSAGEILSTLDGSGTLQAVPFMPEMMQFIGKRFTVAHRVEKICDTVGPGGSRRMRDTVFLDDLRCDGSAHSGCEAECRIYWKEAWLTRVDTAQARPNPPDVKSVDALAHVTGLNTQTHTSGAVNGTLHRCQATQALLATEAIPSASEPTQYLRELSSSNVTPGHLLRVAARILLWKAGALLGLRMGSKQRAPYSKSEVGKPFEPQKLALAPGEWVEVKSAEEIGRTLTEKGTNKGLRFSPAEMLPACGRRFRVRRRIGKLIDERTGRLLTVKNDCIVLDGFVCTGDRSTGRWFCRRELYPYWREAWLTRVDADRLAALEGGPEHASKVSASP